METRSKLIATAAYMAPIQPGQRTGDVDILPYTERLFHEQGSSVYFNALVSAEGFNERVAPYQLRALVFPEPIPESATLEQVLSMPHIGEGMAPVTTPGYYSIGVDGLPPKTDVYFALIADFAA